MSYIVVKTVKGRQYLYEQRTWREGKRVRTESRYLGPVGGGTRTPKKKGLLRNIGAFIKAQGPLMRSLDRFDELAARQAAERELAEKQARDAQLARLHDLYGLKVAKGDPVPEEKAPTTVDLSAPVPGTASSNESPSNAEGPSAAAGTPGASSE